MDELTEYYDVVIPQSTEYKNSREYVSKDWRPRDQLDEKFPVQRRLTDREIVYDLDHVTEGQMDAVCSWLKAIGLKFVAWKSSSEGLHIHFWIHRPMAQHNRKKLAELMSANFKAMFDVGVDMNPMSQGIIRAEYSYNPNHGQQKLPYMWNVNVMFPWNEIPGELLEKAMIPEPPRTVTGKTGPQNGKLPTCMRYILGNVFADCRKRLLFAVVSWFKNDESLSRDAAIATISDWAQRQGLNNIWQIPYMYDISEGRVGCKYRHELLDELGVDMSRCTLETLQIKSKGL